jgi:RHS repeat-associated protein
MLLATKGNYRYAYDPVGNRLASHLGDYAYNAGNQLMSDSNAAYEYDSFGNLHDQKNRIKQPYAFTGREWDRDRETGLYFYRARYYDAEAGRFTSKDPIGFAECN